MLLLSAGFVIGFCGGLSAAILLMLALGRFAETRPYMPGPFRRSDS